MDRILIRHLSGARAGQVDEFPAAGTNEILVGAIPMPRSVSIPAAKIW